ncbi:MAG TPA: zinc ABC transporter substrate-binding protein [Dongiaceae bacterium]|jgi:zinc transport system substrate-binding protein
MLYRSSRTPGPSIPHILGRAGAWSAAALILALGAAGARAEAPAVVTSIKPVHSLVAAVMEGVGAPSLMVKGAASPHTYSLTPSDAEGLQQAQFVFWIGEDFERFLHKAIETLPHGAVSVELGEVQGLTVLPVREGGIWEEHAHESEDHEEHAEGEHAEGEAHDHEQEHGLHDGHLWLDPANAKLMAAAVVEALSAADPANASVYRSNGDKLQGKLDSLDAEIASSLAPVKQTPFIVFHDAYQYFERRYGLNGVGSITVTPEQPPGAKRLFEIREKIIQRQARCVFREPNFEPALVDSVLADTGARSGVLDPEGASLNEGPELYFQLMRGLAESLKHCLSSSS